MKLIRELGRQISEIAVIRYLCPVCLLLVFHWCYHWLESVRSLSGSISKRQLPSDVQSVGPASEQPQLNSGYSSPGKIYPSNLQTTSRISSLTLHSPTDGVTSPYESTGSGCRDVEHHIRMAAGHASDPHEVPAGIRDFPVRPYRMFDRFPQRCDCRPVTASPGLQPLHVKHSDNATANYMR